MIDKPTVLVLGAGASWPFGFPTGGELKDRIAEKVLAGDGEHVKLLELCGYGKLIGHFREALRRSGRTSVDVFLATRGDFMDIGKAAIALALLPCEQDGQLFDIWPRIRLHIPPFDKVNRQEPNAVRSKGNWYELLFNAMTDDMPFETITGNKLSIVTFNYDRSLEHYLLTALMNTYHKSEIDAAKVINSIEIVHVHGSLGKLAWQPGEAALDIPYGTSNPTAGHIKLAASCIKVLPEGQEDSLEFKRARGLIKQAHQVQFLGFGFNRTSIDRLGLLTLPRIQQIGATMRGLSYETIQMLRSISFLDQCFEPLMVVAHKPDEDVFSYLNGHVVLSD